MFKDGEMVVVVKGPLRGRIGIYEYRGPDFITAFLKQGCEITCVIDDDLERYSEYRHGRAALLI